MNTEAAMEAVVTSRDALNATINALNEYIRQAIDEENWLAATIGAKMVAVKASASTGGVDLSTWDGS
jgi:hypothetical protein